MAKLLSAALLALLVFVACSEPVPTGVVTPSVTTQPKATTPADAQAAQPADSTGEPTIVTTAPLTETPHNGTGTRDDHRACLDTRAGGNRDCRANTHDRGYSTSYIEPGADIHPCGTLARNYGRTRGSVLALRPRRLSILAVS